MSSSNPIGPLVPADELFHHQVAETFATVGTTDRDFTEKVCAMAAAVDGSVQLGFGLGKYPNRNVMDAYAGISRGTEQITVRASRELWPDTDRTVIGPISYEVLEPLHTVRLALAPNDTQPVAFEWIFESVVPCYMEERTHMRNPLGSHVSAELIRYHQTGIATSGWIEIDGRRTEIGAGGLDWVSTRDHSWGVRYGVGIEPTDLQPNPYLDHVDFSMIWSPISCVRPDGSRYGLFLHPQYAYFGGNLVRKTIMGGVEHPDGRFEPFVDIDLDFEYDPRTRRLRGGVAHCTMSDGSDRPLTFRVPTDTGFHLGAGLYFGYRGHHHGQWLGAYHEDGERIVDCTADGVFEELHQIRDTFVIVDDPRGGGTGYGNCQPMITGDHPRYGLSRATSFV